MALKRLRHFLECATFFYMRDFLFPKHYSFSSMVDPTAPYSTPLVYTHTHHALYIFPPTNLPTVLGSPTSMHTIMHMLSTHQQIQMLHTKKYSPSSMFPPMHLFTISLRENQTTSHHLSTLQPPHMHVFSNRNYNATTPSTFFNSMQQTTTTFSFYTDASSHSSPMPTKTTPSPQLVPLIYPPPFLQSTRKTRPANYPVMLRYTLKFHTVFRQDHPPFFSLAS